VRTIHIANQKNLDAEVVLASGSQKGRTRYVDGEGQTVRPTRCVRGSLQTALNALTAERSKFELSTAIAAEDPEVDVELFGKQVRRVKRIYLDAETNEPAAGVTFREYVYTPGSEEPVKRQPKEVESNINSETPVKWTGRMLARRKTFSKFLFVHTQQLLHVNGLTYQFLYDMAKELEEKDSFMLIGAGEKGEQRLVMTKNGSPYHGFLEGRTQGDRYLLLLHLTNLELKPLEQADA